MKSNSIEREDYSELYIALREIFINSLIHADFKLEGDIKITRYPNYYQFENPGLLRISKEEFFLGHFSMFRY
jgi:predicted HTH transcriptional regulator